MIVKEVLYEIIHKIMKINHSFLTAEYFIDEPEILKKIYVIVDCMSSIPTFEEETKKAFEYLYSLGMNFVTAEEVVLP